jgi:hypothetical protein
VIVIEIAPNPNCDPVDTRIFNDLEPPRVVTQVRLERTPGQSQWYAVTGWHQHGTLCPAQARKVDDSGEGVILLVSGGDAGLRLQLAASPQPWRLDAPGQWGEPFLLIADPNDLRFT